MARPWFISVSSLWHVARGFDDLVEYVRREIETPGLFPTHHIRVPPRIWHNTVVAVARITPHSGVPAEEQGIASLSRLTSQFGLVDRLRTAVKPHVLEAFELQCHDSGTVVQLRDVDGSLRAMRSTLIEILGPATDCLRSDTGVEVVVGRPVDQGPRTHGSVARSPVSEAPDLLRWYRPIEPRLELALPPPLLVLSDATLSNPRISATSIPLA